MNRPVKTTLLVVPLAVAVLGGGCSSFRHDAKLARGVTPTGVEGLWEGTWQDGCRPSHGGEMQAVLTRQGSQLYRLSTRSHWWKWFTSSIDATVVLTPVGPGQFELRGSEEIWPFGDFGIVGRVDGESFKGTYDASGHPGTIELHRVAAAAH